MPLNTVPETVLSPFEEEAAFRRKLAMDFLLSVETWKLRPDTTLIPDSDEIPSIEDRYHLHEFAEEWFLCYGCKERVEGGKLYCDDSLCQELGGFVRFARKGLSEQRGKDSVFHDGIGQKLLSALQGGYDRARRMPAELRAEILSRDNNTCQRCQKPGSHVDHILGSSNDPRNLRVLCADCNMLRAFTPAVIAHKDIEDEIKAFQDDVWRELVQRVGSEIPLLILDKPDWAKYSRKIAAYRKKIYQQWCDDADSDGFEDVDGYLYSAMQKND